MNVILMPNFNRPEYLKICLELIQKADNADKNIYLFTLDYGFDSKLLEVINEFQLKKEILKTPNMNYSTCKQSFNVLNGLLKAYDLSSDLVYIIEDDIFIGKDFFRFHEAVQSKENLFCSIAVKNHNSAFDVSNNVNAYYHGFGLDYEPWGVCFKKSSIDLIRPNIVPQYFNKPSEYMKKFVSFVNPGHIEQDGLIRRIREQSDLEVAFPHVPRAYHAGLYGYHRGINLPNSYDERLNFLRNVCFSNDAMRKYAQNDFFVFDSEPINLETDFTEMIYKEAHIGLTVLPKGVGMDTKDGRPIRRNKGKLTAMGLMPW